MVSSGPLLFYKKFKGELEEYGFKMNPYDPCLFNKTTKDGNQHTAIFHVDDGLASHKDPIENTKILIGITFARRDKFPM